MAEIDLEVSEQRFSRVLGDGHIGIPEYLLTTADILGPKNLIFDAGAPICPYPRGKIYVNRLSTRRIFDLWSCTLTIR